MTPRGRRRGPRDGVGSPGWGQQIAQTVRREELPDVVAEPCRRRRIAGIALRVAVLITQGAGRGLRLLGYLGICTGMLITMPLRPHRRLGHALWSWLHYRGVRHFSLVGLVLWVATLPRQEETLATPALPESATPSGLLPRLREERPQVAP